MPPPPFDVVITALLDPSTPFPPKLLHRFSDIQPENLESLKKVWLNVDSERRANIMADLEEINDSDTLVSFEDLARFTLKDTNAQVRCSSIRLLWDAGDTPHAHNLIEISKSDPSEDARASAASGLGYYVYLGEMDEINDMLLDRVINHLMVLLTGKDTTLVQRRALESLGFRTDEEIDDHIRSAYHSGDDEWVTSALFAMGRSANQKWSRMVLEMFANANTKIRAEAIRAAGELEVKAAREPLMILLESPDALDEEVFFNAFWSLSKIGGRGVRKRLEKIIASVDEDTAEDLEDALDNLDFTETVNRTMFNFNVESGNQDDDLIPFDIDRFEDEQGVNEKKLAHKRSRSNKPN